MPDIRATLLATIMSIIVNLHPNKQKSDYPVMCEPSPKNELSYFLSIKYILLKYRQKKPAQTSLSNNRLVILKMLSKKFFLHTGQ